MEVKAGYKQTEVGVIPEDWEVKTLGDCLLRNPEYGINAPAVPYSDNLPTYIRITDISEEGRFLPEKKSSVNNINSNNYFLENDDIVFARTGASTGKTYLYNSNDGDLVFAGFLIRVKVNPNELIAQYLKSYTETGAYWNWVKIMSMRSGQPGINGNEYAQLRIPLPPLPEQQAIASALSDVDALITALEQLITKKRNIKQGAMQQLLTGEKRLPGFGGVWGLRKLGELLDYEQPTAYIVTDTKYADNNDTPVLTAGKTFILGYTHEETGIFRNLPVIIFDDFTTTNKYVAFPFKVKSSAMKILKLKDKKTNLRFVFEKMQLINFHLGDHKRYWISEYQNLEIEIPQSEEQQAIAQILRDMDAEIEALEHKQAKYKAIKQGMMQELLTGKTRLV
jgi:type I restriction enzyme S subunit